MKTWHFILIGGGLLVVAACWFVRSRNQSTAVPGVKVGTGPGDAGAPPLPIIAPSQPATGKSLAFLVYSKPNAFGRNAL